MPEWIVTPEESGLKLLPFLVKRFEDRYSSRFLKRALEQHRCKVNDHVEHFASFTLSKGDYISFSIEDFHPASSIDFEPSQVLYEDDALLAYNKPAGINSDEQGIAHLLKTYNPNLRLVHRLDRETTGALLFTKSEKVLNDLIQQFRDFQVNKCYAAFVDGVPAKSKGIIDNHLVKKRIYQGQTIWGASAKGGLHAHTEWELKKRGKNASLLYCYPKTGRTHQLRVHLAGIGHPILGDFQYGKDFICPYQPGRILLHALSITFKHPASGKILEIEAKLPDDFSKASRELLKG